MTKWKNSGRSEIMALEEEIKGADIIIRSVARQGTKRIYFVTGGASLETGDALFRIGHRHGIQMIDTAKEDGAGFAAEGDARSTGEVGVYLETSGPGATNGITPLTDASLDSIPVVKFTGQVPKYMIGKGAFQEAPMVDMTRPVTKRSYFVERVEDLPDIIAEAFHVAKSGRPGPVHIDVPKDITQAKMAFRSGSYANGSPDLPHDLEHKVGAVFNIMQKAARPVVYVGGGVISAGAYTELLRLSELARIPVTTTLMGLGAFPGTHTNSLGMLGMHGTAYANFAINGSPLGNYDDGADFVLAIGARFDDRVTGKVSEFAQNAYIAHVDIDKKENGKNKNPDIFIHSDATTFLQILNSRIRQEAFRPDYSSWWNHLESLKQKFPLRYNFGWADDNGHEIPTQYIMQELWKLTKNDEPIVVTGVGQHQMFAAQYFLVDKPRRFLTSAGLGSMGFGLPAALGAQMANPKKLVIDLDGDRSFWMTGNELETIARFNLPVKVVIFDNGGSGMVQQWQDHQYESRYSGTKYKNINFANYAQLFMELNPHIGSRRISKLGEVEPALKEMVNHRGPYVLHVDARYEHCLPMVPAGGTVKEIILQK